MVKRALKFAIPFSLGMTLGSISIRYIFPKLYNETFKPTLLVTFVYFCIAYIASFLVILFIEWVRSKIVRK